MSAARSSAFLGKKLFDMRPLDVFAPSFLKQVATNYWEANIKTNSMKPLVHILLFYSGLGIATTHIAKHQYLVSRPFH